MVVICLYLIIFAVEIIKKNINTLAIIPLMKSGNPGRVLQSHNANRAIRNE